jgi:hypothetical protein
MPSTTRAGKHGTAPHTGGGLYRSMEDRPRHLSRSPLVKQASTPPA